MPQSSSDSTSLAFDSLEQEVFLNLWRTYDCLKVLEDELFSQYGISPQQYNALRLLESASPSGMQTLTLGRKLISRGPDTTRILDRLEKSGWVSRSRPAENRRVVEVAITSDGLALLKKIRPAILEMHKRQLGHLSERQQRDLIRLLKAARKPHDDASCSWMES